MAAADYHLPVSRLSPLKDATKTPLVLIACGSFSPITYLHLRMFEMARDQAQQHTDFEVVGGYLSPVSDDYKKPGLAPGIDRYNMCRLACVKASNWLMVDDWEVRQPAYSKTADVLDHFRTELNEKHGGVPLQQSIDADLESSDPNSDKIERKKVRIMLLAGSDLIQTMSEPGVWDEQDLHHILGDYGCFIVERAESEIDQSIFSSSSVHSRSPLSLYRDNIFMVPQMVRNDVSSTKVRLFIRRGMSVIYLIPTPVVKYIETHGLYRDQRYHGEPGVNSRPSSNNQSTASLVQMRDTDMVEYDQQESPNDEDDEFADDGQIEDILKNRDGE